MPERETIKKAIKDKREGNSASTQAGEFVHKGIKNIRKGEHGARSEKQAIAIGLSEARGAGVDLKPPAKGKTSEKTRHSATPAYRKGQRHESISPTRSRAGRRYRMRVLLRFNILHRPARQRALQKAERKQNDHPQQKNQLVPKDLPSDQKQQKKLQEQKPQQIRKVCSTNMELEALSDGTYLLKSQNYLRNA